MELIKKDYQELFGKSLEDAIKGDTSGAYRECLMSIVRGNRVL